MERFLTAIESSIGPQTERFNFFHLNSLISSNHILCLDLQLYCPDKHWNKNKDLICKQHSVSKATEKCSLQGYQFAFGSIDRNLEYFSMNSFGVYGSPVQLQNEARQTNRQIKYDFEFKYDVENNKIIKYGSAESSLCTSSFIC
ncbi:hypothetical protein ACTFIR_007147 [Dictyostelium discoideum]